MTTENENPDMEQLIHANLFGRMLHYFQCQLATEYHFLDRKGSPKGQRLRHAGITDSMAVDLLAFSTADIKRRGHGEGLKRALERWERIKASRQGRTP